MNRLWAETTQEEIIIWSAYFGYLNKEQDKALQAAKKKRR